MKQVRLSEGGNAGISIFMLLKLHELLSMSPWTPLLFYTLKSDILRPVANTFKECGREQCAMRGQEDARPIRLGTDGDGACQIIPRTQQWNFLHFFQEKKNHFKIIHSLCLYSLIKKKMEKCLLSQIHLLNCYYIISFLSHYDTQTTKTGWY